jgi:carbon-monoxide dehydrogenase medium subunit
MAMALTVLRLQDGKIVEPRLALGGVEPHPRRLAGVERSLAGRPANLQSFTAAADLAASAIDPMEDAMTNAEYRRDLANVVTLRALQQTNV